MPNACRTKLRTIRIRVNEVIISRIAGATDKIVSTVTIFRAGTTLSTPSVSLRFNSRLGIPPRASEVQKYIKIKNPEMVQKTKGAFRGKNFAIVWVVILVSP